MLALKENHPSLHGDIKLWLDENDAQGHVYQHEHLEKNHGRIETRRTVISKDLDCLPQMKEWPGLKAVAMVESTREIGSKTSRERRYYLCLTADVGRIALTIRHHWVIENQQHWIFGCAIWRRQASHAE